MKVKFFALLTATALMVGCCVTKGTLEASRKDFVQLRKELVAGHLKVVKYKDPKRNEIATKDWIDVADAAISNIDRALDEKSDGVAPVTSGSR